MVSHPKGIWGQRFQLELWSTFFNTNKVLLIYIVLHTFSHFFLAVWDTLLNRTQKSKLFIWEIYQARLYDPDFPEFASSYKKSAQFICWFLRYSSFLEYHDYNFDHVHQIIFSYPELVSPFKKSVYSIDFFMIYSQFKISVIRVATTHFWPHPSQYFSINS